jgi:hypothetical protein
LTAVKVANLKAKGMYPDGDGLYLRVTETGTKNWIYRYSTDGKLRDMGLGTVRDVSLAQARILAGELRRQRLDGLDPIAARKVQTAVGLTVIRNPTMRHQMARSKMRASSSSSTG